MTCVGPSLPCLAARPPTPPKKNIGHTPEMVPRSVQLSSSTRELQLNTPEESPSSSAEYPGDSSEKVSKRVGFSPWTEYHKHPSNTGFGSSSNDRMRILPPSKDCRSSKSILKSKPDIDSPIPMEDPMILRVDDNISSMLETTMRHLEGSSRSARIDAYSTLLGCLSAYDNVPEPQDLAGKLLDLLRFIRRDIWAKQEDTGVVDTQLATQALKLLLYFVTTPFLAPLLPDEVSELVLEESILTLENQAVPKIMVTHYLQLLIQEGFAAQHLNNNRVNRILLALGRVGTYVKGNRVAGQRLMVYRRLLQHSKSAMISHMESWIDHLISGLLSTFKEIRGRAVLFGSEASLALGAIKSVSQTFMDMLNRESPDGKKVVEFLATRLTTMASVPEDGVWVPQIWSIVILFLRGRRHQLEGWEHLKPWLLIIQKCFNSSDPQVKYQSNRAWSRLIFAVSPDSSTSPQMVKMLRQPILPQLERRNGSRGSQMAKSPKQVARSSYCTLLYYAFRPSATHVQLDHYWEEYVCQMFPQNLSRNKDDLNYFCQVLAGLFSSLEPKPWDENRANINKPVRADELPCLDSKWVRLRAAEILKAFELLFHDADWTSRHEVEAPIILAWRSFTTAIRLASSKEVKTSTETMTALAHITNTLERFWQQCLTRRSSQGLSPAMEKLDRLIRETVSQLGLIPFNEKRLARTKVNSYEAAETPSSRSDQHKGPLTSPVFVLLGLLIRSVGHQEIEHNYRDALKNLIDVATRSATSRRTRLAVFRDLASLTASEHDADADTRLLVWQLIAEATTRAFTPEKTCSLHVESPQYLGHEYRDAVKILESAVSLRPQKAIKEWQDLGTLIAQVLREEISPDAVALILTEPLAKAIISLSHSDCNDFLLSAARFLLETAQWPRSRPAIDHARKLLWGVSPITPKGAAAVDPFDHLYAMTSTLLQSSYSSFQPGSCREIDSFLSAVAVLIAHCPVPIMTTLLKHIQLGIARWIQDPNGVLAASVSGNDSARVFPAVRNLWAATTTAIEGLPTIDSRLLSMIETLIVSSLKSRHKAILNDSILLWNRTFGRVDKLDYPAALRPVLLRLRTLTDIELPNFAEDDNEEMSSPLIFLDSQIDEDTPPRSSSPLQPVPRQGSHVQPSSPRSRQAASKSRQSPYPSPQEQGSKMTPKRRFRHDDSQIQFAAIDSSPLQLDELESQMLTDRQKEVRQRQILEATTMFPNVGLAPQPRDHLSNGPPPKLELSKNGMASSPMGRGGDSPRSPIDGTTLDDVIGSSPTPRSRSGRSRRGSAPPGSPSLSPVVQISSSYDVHMACGPKTPTKRNCDASEKEAYAAVTGPKTPMWDDSDIAVGSPHLDQRTDLPEAPTNQPSTPQRNLVSTHEPAGKVVDSPPVSDNEVFVDAQPEPAPLVDDPVHRPASDVIHAWASPSPVSTPLNPASAGDTVQEPVTPTMHGETAETFQNAAASVHASGTSEIIDSFHDAEPPHAPTEDDQIAAQLVRDLERASSQVDGETGHLPCTASPRASNHKRKSAPDGSDAVRKKAKTPPARKGQTIQIVVETRRSGPAHRAFAAAGPHDVSSPSPHDAPLRPQRVPSGRFEVPPNRTGGRDGTGRPAGSSSATPSVQREGSAETRVSVPDSRHPSPDGPPRAGERRRRSARLNRLPSASQHAPEGLDPMGSDGVAEGRHQAPPRGEHRHMNATAQRHTGARGEEGDATMPSRGMTDSGSEGSDHEIPHDVTGCIDSGPAVPASFAHVQDSLPMARIRRAQRNQAPEDSSRPSPSSPPRLVSPGQVTGGTGTPEPGPAADALGARDILRGFTHLLDHLKRITVGMEDERELVSVLVDSVREVHEAGRRHGNGNGNGNGNGVP